MMAILDAILNIWKHSRGIIVDFYHVTLLIFLDLPWKIQIVRTHPA